MPDNLVRLRLIFGLVNLTIEIDPDATIYDLKECIEISHGIPVESQKYFLGTKELDDNYLCSFSCCYALLGVISHNFADDPLF